MKRVLFTIITALTFTFSSCTKEHSEPDLTVDVLGTYQGSVAAHYSLGPPPEPKACEFKISKVDHNTVNLEFISGFDNPTLTLDLTKEEGRIKFFIKQLEVDSANIEGLSYNTYLGYHGQYLLDKNEFEITFAKTFDGQSLLVSLYGKN